MATKGQLLGITVLVIGGVAGCGRVVRPSTTAGTQPPPPLAVPAAVVLEGIDAMQDVAVGGTFAGPAGHPTTELTIVNKTPEKHDYTVSVVFYYGTTTDLFDIATVSVLGVDPGTNGRATVVSRRTYSGESSAGVTTALRSCVAK